MDVNTPASKRSQLIGNTAIVRKRCVIHTNSTCVCWGLSVATFTQKRKDASFDLWPPLVVGLIVVRFGYYFGMYPLDIIDSELAWYFRRSILKYHNTYDCIIALDALSRPQVDLTFERFRFLAPCQRLRAIVCVLSAHLRRVLKSTCVCLRLREQCLRTEITSVSRVANVLLLRFVAGNMDVNTPAFKRSQLIGNTAIVRKRCIIHTNSTCVCWRLSVATFTQKRKDASFDLWPPLDVSLDNSFVCVHLQNAFLSALIIV